MEALEHSDGKIWSVDVSQAGSAPTGRSLELPFCHKLYIYNCHYTETSHWRSFNLQSTRGFGDSIKILNQVYQSFVLWCLAVDHYHGNTTEHRLQTKDIITLCRWCCFKMTAVGHDFNRNIDVNISNLTKHFMCTIASWNTSVNNWRGDYLSRKWSGDWSLSSYDMLIFP